MRHIEKGTPVVAFVEYLRKPHSPDWNSVSSEIKKACRLHIISTEQNHRSGYTERKLSNSSPSLHIDHFRKQALFPELSLDWENFIVDEHAVDYGADYKDSHIKKCDYEVILNPVTDNPQDFFEYMTNGEIVVREDLPETDRCKAQRTIDLFKLNHPSLKEERSSALRNLIDWKHGGMRNDDVLNFAVAECSFVSLFEYFCEPERFSLLNLNP